jgi:translation initiation factor IF-2
MTEDRDFKNVVRRRAAKTGESYQAARRQLEEASNTAHARALVEIMVRTPRGIVVGCTIDRGTIGRGDNVIVLHDGHPVHEAVVAAIRNFQADIEAASAGLKCGLILEPPYKGPLADEVLAIG